MAQYRAIPATTTADTAIVSGRVVLRGMTITEDAGTPAAASFILRDGTSAAGTAVMPIKLGAGGTHSIWFGDEGILFRSGLFLDMVAGSVSGAVYVG